GVYFFAEYTRYTRGSMIDVLGAQYLNTARAKGLAEAKVLFKHAFRNALLPLVTITGLFLPVVFEGAVVLEQVFQWPGMGTLLINSIHSRDYPILMGINLIAAIFVLLG